MKVVAADVIRLAYGPGLNWVIVRLEAEDGTFGLGEASHTGADHLTINAIADHVVPRVLGREVDPNEAAARLRRVTDAPFRPPVGFSPLASAASAVEQALWDLHARIRGVPLATALGGRVRDRVSLYANVNRGIRERTPDTFASAAKRAQEEGFAAVKCAPFDDVRPGQTASASSAFLAAGIERVESVRDAIGCDIGLMVDCHGRFDRISGAKAAHMLKAFDLTWLEEPVFWEEDPRGLEAISEAASMPIAAGELLVGAPAYARLLESDAVGVVMTDVQHCGGVATVRSVAAQCESVNRPLSLHNPAGPVGTLVSAHLSAAIARIGVLEYPVSETRRTIVNRLAPDAEHVVDGELVVDDSPGIGVTLDLAEVERHGVVRRVEYEA